jgi:hypothetical protein
MAAFVEGAIEAVRGSRPHPSSSFSQIGVDSLGAVMFIRHLSDSLDGLRIDAAKVFAPGVTVASFSEDLFKRLTAERPQLLQRLGIDVAGSSTGVTSYSVDDEADESGHSFGDVVIMNRGFLEGVRGVLTFMVSCNTL